MDIYKILLVQVKNCHKTVRCHQMKDSLSLMDQIGIYIYIVMMVIIRFFFSAVYFEQKDYDKCIEVSEEKMQSIYGFTSRM
jgi:hypothetical protein